MSEWSNVPVPKTGILNGITSSNLVLCAKINPSEKARIFLFVLIIAISTALEMTWAGVRV